MKEFIALHNRTVSRDEIQTVIALAKEQNNTEVIYRLSKILNDHPDSNRFNINIINYPTVGANSNSPSNTALAGARHSGDYREALDECGRLKKGWHFVDGKVVKVQKRSGLLSQYTEKEFGHPFTKTLKAKFKELNWKYDRKNKRYYTPVPENEAEKEQHAQMFAFIKQEKFRIEANGNFTSAPSSAKSAPSDSSSKTYTAETFAKDLDFNTLKRSYSWISFDPDTHAERDIKQWGEMFYSLYNSLSEEAKKQGVLEKYNSAFNNGYNSLLKLEREIIATRSKTFSTAITGGAGITEKQLSTNEKRMRLQAEKSELWNQKYDKLHKILEKIAKNKPADLYQEGDVIKSTDNNAMTKLQQKLKMLQDRKTMLKNGVVAAKEYQKNKDLSVFKKYNIDEETTKTIVNHIDKGGKPTEKDMYNWFTMPYLNRDIKEVEKRIAILKKNQAKGTDEILIEGGKIVHNGEAQRLQIFFDGIPSKEVREALKANAFKWAPTAKAWQRTLTENAKYAVNQYLIKTGILKLRTALFGTLPTFKTRKEAKKYFKAWAAENLTGKKVYHKELDKYLVFSSRGRDHVLSSNISFNKMKLILQAEEMLKNSHLIAFEEDYKKRENIKGVYRMRSNAVLEGEDIKVILTLREGENGVIYYDHKIEEIKESTTPPRKSLANPFCGDSAPTNTPAKTVPNSTLSAPEVFVEHSPDPYTQPAPSITPRNNSLANRMATLQNRTFETFIIAEPQMQAFLGDVERKNTGSTAITITGGAGSGKTRFAFQFINALAQNYKVGHASLEEQPDSKLYFDKVQQYLDQTAQANVEAPEIENMQDLQALIERNDVIVIDSFTKIREWNRNFLLDRDLRKKYNGKLFLIIFQQTVAGNMRGGTTSEFDGDIILYTQVFPNYRENYIYPSKNRYNSTPSEQLRYSVYHQQLLPSESTPPDSSPVTSNTYEVIY